MQQFNALIVQTVQHAKETLTPTTLNPCLGGHVVQCPKQQHRHHVYLLLLLLLHPT